MHFKLTFEKLYRFNGQKILHQLFTNTFIDTQVSLKIVTKTNGTIYSFCSLRDEILELDRYSQI